MALLAAIFPGQGSQYVGMGKKLLQEFPASRLCFEEAEDAIQVNLRKLCCDGPDSDLRLTANTQPAILTVSIAQWNVLQAEAGLSAKLFLGHSLGEYSALVAAERLTLGAAVKLVRHRGEAMQRAVPQGEGAMAAILSYPAANLEVACQNASTAKEWVAIANYNSPAQLVVAGHRPAVEKLCKELEAQKIRSVQLPVSAPFHSKLMAPAKSEMTAPLQASAFKPQANQLIPNLSAEIVCDYRVEYLIEQIDHPVLWQQSMQAAAAGGYNNFVEVGPGKVLVGLGKRCVGPDAKFLAGDDTEATIKALRQQS